MVQLAWISRSRTDMVLHVRWSIVLTGVCLLAGAFDDRLFNGVSVWSKPFKFALSLAVYFATLLVFSHYLPNGYLRTTAGRILVVSLAWVAGAEMAYITIQGALGEASHFNATTAFHGLMYSLMGFGAFLAGNRASLVWLGDSAQ